MNNVVKVNDKELPVIEWKGQRVITTAQLADVYGATEKQIKQNYGNNEERFREREHFFLLKGEELREFKNKVENFDPVNKNNPTNFPLVGKNANQLYLWTRKGASRHCKMLGTDKAWEQFDALEENYYNPQKISINDIIANPDFGIQLLTSYKEEKEKNQFLIEQIGQQQDIIERQAPKVTYYDLVLQCNNLLSTTEIAKDYGKSAQWLNKYLQEKKIIYWQGTKRRGRYYLYADYANMGYAQSKTTAFINGIGELDGKSHLYWTQKGRYFIYEQLKTSGIVPIVESEG